jgi:cell division protein FtsL
MVKLNFVLLACLLGCALGLVASQHKARKLFVELQQEDERAKQLEVEWGQLRLEASTWAMHSRIERIAAGNLSMRVPPPSRIQVVGPVIEAGAAQPPEAGR